MVHHGRLKAKLPFSECGLHWWSGSPPFTDSSFHPSSHCLGSHLPSSSSSHSPQHPAIQLSIYQPTQDFNSLSPDTLTHHLPSYLHPHHSSTPACLTVCPSVPLSIHPSIHLTHSSIHPVPIHLPRCPPTRHPPSRPPSPFTCLLMFPPTLHPHILILSHSLVPVTSGLNML